MKFTISISQKFGISFGILTLFAILAIQITNQQINDIDEKTSYIIHEQKSTEKLLVQLSNIVNESTHLTKNWAYIDFEDNSPEKNRLKYIYASQYPLIKNQLVKHKNLWEKNDVETFKRITLLIEDTLFKYQKILITALPNYDSYLDQKNKNLIKKYVSPRGLITNCNNKILKRVNLLQTNFESSTTHAIQTLETANNRLKNTLIISVIILVLSSLILTYTIITLFVYPISKIKHSLDELSLGILPPNISNQRRDEIGEIVNKLNELTTNLKKTAEFSLELGKGNYNAELKTLSNDDVLRNSLLELRDSLESATKEAEQRRQKEEIQNWITNGLANFADILRQNTDDFSTVGNNILRYLVDYMKINQGGIFVYNDDNPENPYLKLIAVYAYNRIKFADKQILPGEGLVGTCLLEKNTIYLKEVPNGYLEITSGLGKANPRNILIVPLKIDNNVLGVIELASFNEIELHEIEFIEKIAESIASTLQTVRINEGTQKLLERSKEQAEAMKSQEEEMRQNIEELQATQEEASRKEEQLEKALSQAHDEISSLRKKIEELEREAVISLTPQKEPIAKVTFTEEEENQ